MSFCSQCGSARGPSDKYCGSCGASFSSSAPPETPVTLPDGPVGSYPAEGDAAPESSARLSKVTTRAIAIVIALLVAGLVVFSISSQPSTGGQSSNVSSQPSRPSGERSPSSDLLGGYGTGESVCNSIQIMDDAWYGRDGRGLGDLQIQTTKLPAHLETSGLSPESELFILAKATFDLMTVMFEYTEVAPTTAEDQANFEFVLQEIPSAFSVTLRQCELAGFS